MSTENGMFGYTQEEERRISGRAREWDTENNNREALVMDNTEGTIRIAPDSLFDCPIHGNTQNVITFTINNTNHVYCTECLHEALSSHFTPLERINDE